MSRQSVRLPGTPKNRRACGDCGRMHFMGGRCTTSKGPPVHSFQPETDSRSEVHRTQLWAVIDRARTMIARAGTSRAGSVAYDLAAEALEKELGRLPEAVWEK